MGKVLRALKLQPPKPPEELRVLSQSIGGIESKLGSNAVKVLKLKDSAKAVATNLNALKGKVEPALLEAKTREFESLANRIAQRSPADAALVTDAGELQMLLAETECALKDDKKNREALERARQSFGNALIKRLDSGGELAQDLMNYIQQHLDEGNSTRVAAALKALDALRASPDKRVADACAAVSKRLAQQAMRKQQEGGPSLAPRESSRTPNDVLVHLMSTLSTALQGGDDPKLKKLAAAGRKLFMTHSLDTAKVKELLRQAEQVFTDRKDLATVGQCQKLASQLPEKDEALQDTQLHDNLYGRVFDTKLVSTLVKEPPAPLLQASGKSGAAFAKLLEDNEANEDAAAYFVKNYIVGDKRPWSAAVPAFEDMAKAKTGREALAAIKKFLGTTPTTGQEIIAFSYIMAKLPQAQKSTEHEPKWLAEASMNYGAITKQANRERGAGQKDQILSKAAGITMLHQPDASDDDNLVESERPGTANRMGVRGQLQEGQELGEVKHTTQNDIQLKQALPFASGVSGTTNILLHLYAELEKQAGKGGTGVSPQEFLMNSMMFLVYDGGHSMHEAMWTANQIEVDLKTLSFGLADPSQENKTDTFVSDYDRFIDKFPESVKKEMAKAQETAWQGTQEYLQQNSFFAQ